MSGASETVAEYVIICVDAEAEALAALHREVSDFCGSEMKVRACSDAEQALALIEELDSSGVRVPLIITAHVLPGMSGIDLLLALHEKPRCRATRKVLASARANVSDLTRALNAGALHRNILKPWTPEPLRECLRSLLTSFFVHHAPEECGRFDSVIDHGQFPRAYRESRHDKRALDLQIKTLKRSFLANMDMTDEEVENALGAGIDDALNNPPQRQFPAGSVLLQQDEAVDTIYVLVSGNVQLSRKADGPTIRAATVRERSAGREVVLHEQSGGRIIGLLALAHGQRAFYTWRATTDITVIPLSLEQLETALQTNPYLSGYLVTSLIRTMGTRSHRTAQLLLKVENLNIKLRAERDQLTDALHQLGKTQLQLIESQKMATLGQLSAGVAHELNNPIAAIQRAADFIREDMVALLRALPDGEVVEGAMLSALTAEPLSTAEQRKQRATLAQTVGDDALAQRLVRAGITTAEEYRSSIGRLSGKKRDRLLEKSEKYHQLGLSLRNISTCSKRVSAIVDSLRSYTRADESPVANVNLNEGLEGTLLMFGHNVREVEVVKEYGDLSPIACHVGEINQVWTNIVSNALQAMNGKGTLRIETDMKDAGHVRVRITDSGPGIPKEYLDRVFDLNFTTKHGSEPACVKPDRSSFGLGLGLAICRQIVTRHGGTIEAASQPGRTCLTVILPVRSQRTST